MRRPRRRRRARRRAELQLRAASWRDARTTAEAESEEGWERDQVKRSSRQEAEVPRRRFSLMARRLYEDSDLGSTTKDRENELRKRREDETKRDKRSIREQEEGPRRCDGRRGREIQS